MSCWNGRRTAFRASRRTDARRFRSLSGRRRTAGGGRGCAGQFLAGGPQGVRGPARRRRRRRRPRSLATQQLHRQVPLPDPEAHLAVQRTLHDHPRARTHAVRLRPRRLPVPVPEPDREVVGHHPLLRLGKDRLQVHLRRQGTVGVARDRGLDREPLVPERHPPLGQEAVRLLQARDPLHAHLLDQPVLRRAEAPLHAPLRLGRAGQPTLPSRVPPPPWSKGSVLANGHRGGGAGSEHRSNCAITETTSSDLPGRGNLVDVASDSHPQGVHRLSRFRKPRCPAGWLPMTRRNLLRPAGGGGSAHGS